LTASVRPSLAFSLNASDTYAEGVASDKTVLSAQLTMSTPLMITSATRAKTRNLSAKLAAARYARDDALRSSGLRARETFRNLETARGQLAAVMAEVDASRLVAVGIRNEFEFGQKTSLDVQDAEQDVNDAEIRLVSAQHALLTAGYRLQAALGGLTSNAMGLDDVIGTLQSEPVPKDRLGKILPFVGND
jgi:outer membrane protein